MSGLGGPLRGYPDMGGGLRSEMMPGIGRSPPGAMSGMMPGRMPCRMPGMGSRGPPGGMPGMRGPTGDMEEF